MHTTIVEHPLLADILTRIRDADTTQGAFGDLVSRATNLLMFEATTRLSITSMDVLTPVGQARGARLELQPLLLPVLRAGLTMLESARRLLPEAPIGFAGLRRDETTAAATWYLQSLPDDLHDREAIILEPMIATGGTLAQVVDEVAERGVTGITIVSLICAEAGLEVLQRSKHADRLQVVAAACDPALNDLSFVEPGLGDAGDRAFGWS